MNKGGRGEGGKGRRGEGEKGGRGERVRRGKREGGEGGRGGEGRREGECCWEKVEGFFSFIIMKEMGREKEGK